MQSYFTMTDRVFTPLRKYGFWYTLLVAFGGLWYPKLGLTVLLVMLSLMSISFFKGRYWCGNFCAHGSLFDSVLFKWSRNVKIPQMLRSKIFAGLFFTFFTLNLVRKIVSASAFWGTAMFWDRLGFVFVGSYLMVTLVGGTLAIIVSPRTWCHFCPMALMQTLSYKVGKRIGVTKRYDDKITVANQEMCVKCGKCARVCPMQLDPHLEFSQLNQLNNEACIRCSTCVQNCPLGILSLSNEHEAQEIYNLTLAREHKDTDQMVSVAQHLKC